MADERCAMSLVRRPEHRDVVDSMLNEYSSVVSSLLRCARRHNPPSAPAAPILAPSLGIIARVLVFGARRATADAMGIGYALRAHTRA